MNIRRVFVFAVLLALAAPAWAQPPKPLGVVASVAPLKYFADKIAGGRATVTVLAPKGADPHTFEPRPSQMALVAKADVFLAQGVEYEHAWLPKFQKSAPGLTVVDTTAGIALLPSSERDDDHGHAKAGTERHELETDPHTWTAPLLAARQAATIAAALTRLDPDGEQAYRAGLAAFTAEAEALDNTIRARLSGVRPGAKFLTFHPAWAYFAKAYGLEEVAIEAGGKEPGPRTLKAIIDQAKTLGVTVVLVQPQFSRKSAQTVADAIGARLVVADDLADDWAANLAAVADAIAQAAR